MMLPNTAHTLRPWRIAMLPATAIGSCFKGKVARPRPTFVTPPRDSMGP